MRTQTYTSNKAINFVFNKARDFVCIFVYSVLVVCFSKHAKTQEVQENFDEIHEIFRTLSVWQALCKSLHFLQLKKSATKSVCENEKK